MRWGGGASWRLARDLFGWPSCAQAHKMDVFFCFCFLGGRFRRRCRKSLNLVLLVPRGQQTTHVQDCPTDTDRYLQLTVRKFRRDHHSCLRTVICGWQSVRFVQTVILTHRPNTGRASHYRARTNGWRSVHFARTVICGWRSVRFARTVILAYRPSFTIHGPYVEV